MRDLKKQAVDMVFDELIIVENEGKNHYIAIDPLTHLADLGFTEEEAVENLKKAILKHIEIMTEISAKKRQSKQEIQEMLKR